MNDTCNSITKIFGLRSLEITKSMPAEQISIIYKELPIALETISKITGIPRQYIGLPKRLNGIGIHYGRGVIDRRFAACYNSNTRTIVLRPREHDGYIGHEWCHALLHYVDDTLKENKSSEHLYKYYKDLLEQISVERKKGIYTVMRQYYEDAVSLGRKGSIYNPFPDQEEMCCRAFSYMLWQACNQTNNYLVKIGTNSKEYPHGKEYFIIRQIMFSIIEDIAYKII